MVGFHRRYNCHNDSCESTLVTLCMKLDGQVIAAMLWERPLESLAAPREKKNENVLVWAR